MAWIEKKRSGFRARWRDAKGRVQEGPVLATKDAAHAWAIDHGHAKAPTHDLVKLLEDFCESRIAEQGIQVTYSRDLLQRLPSLFTARRWVTADHITITAIDSWWKDTDGKGVRRPLAQLLSLLRWAFHHRDVPVPAKVLTYRAPRRSRKVKEAELLTADQVSLILEAAAGYTSTGGGRTKGRPTITWPGFNAHLTALMHYLSTYGARPVTACRLRIKHVNMVRGTLTLSAKRSGEWEHPLRDDTLKYFATIIDKREKNPEAPLFLSHRRVAWKLTPAGEAEQLSNWYHTHIGSKLNLGVCDGIYRLKDYALSIMRRNGMDPETVSKISGHLTVALVDDVYLHTGQEQMRAALKMLPPQMPPRTTPK